MINKSDILSLSFLELAPFTGSDGLLRYKIEKKMEDDNKRLYTTVWFGELSSENTPDEEKTDFTADFSDEGVAEIVDWLNEKS